MTTSERLGFIGLGTMGEPMCRNLARKTGRPVFATDPRPEPLRRLAAVGVTACASVDQLAHHADVIFLSLPNGGDVEAVCAGDGGILGAGGRTSVVVDCGTSPLALTRSLARRCAEVGIEFLDAPVARTREAAEEGKLSIMVGAAPALFERVRPYLAAMGSDITRCGPVGSGQVVKLMNNMVLFETVGALAEALAIAESAGLDQVLLLEALSKGSADSFALRNHGMKAMLPGEFPENAFAADYALKDLTYALELAHDAGIDAAGAEVAKARLTEAIRRGYGRQYWPVLLKVVADRR